MKFGNRIIRNIALLTSALLLLTSVDLTTAFAASQNQPSLTECENPEEIQEDTLVPVESDFISVDPDDSTEAESTQNMEGFTDDWAALYDEDEAGPDGFDEAEVDDFGLSDDGSLDSVTEGCVKMAVQGTFYTKSAETILARLNEIRYEACKKGYRNPATGGKLTPEDYKPLKWSKDMETIARLRAIEADLLNSHSRPNGKGCFTAEQDLHVSYSSGENLAWNYSGIMYGIEQWYDEKGDYARGEANFSKTGHYQSIINPKNTYTGIGCFKAPGAEWYCVAQRFAQGSGLDETKDATQGSVKFPVEIANRYISSITISELKSVMVPGAAGTMTATVKVAIPDYFGNSRTFSGKILEAEITSSDPSVLGIDSEGNYTVAAIPEGTSQTVTVTLKVGGRS